MPIRTTLIASTLTYKALLMGCKETILQCVAEQTNGVSSAGEVTRLECNYRGIQTVVGIKELPEPFRGYI